MTKSNNGGNNTQKPSQHKQPSKPEQKSYSIGVKINEVNGTGPRNPKSTKK